MAVLYDIALVIGGEVSVQPLLVKTLQRLLYHTSFPTGLVFLDLPPDDGTATIEVKLDAMVGDFGLTGMVGQSMILPTGLLHGAAELVEAPEWLQALPGASRPYRFCLRLPIEHEGVLLLLAPHLPSTQLPLAHIFQPVMANLAKAILLCRHNDIYAEGLVNERNTARQSLADSEDKFRSINAAAQDAIMLIDDEDHVVYWNPAAERLFGYTVDEVLGQEAHCLIVPQRYRDRFAQGFAHFRSCGEGPVIGKTIEVEALCKDGGEFPVELSISSLKLKGHWHAVGILRDITERRRLEAAEHEHTDRLQRALLGTIQAIALTVEMRDPYTAGHQLRVSRLAVAIATELGWSVEQIEGIRLGAMIHDIGNIYVPSEILNRPGRLSDIEFEIIKRHPQVGYDIIKDVELPWPVAQIILQHHERLDGSGYPNQLVAEQIIPEARVLAVADVVEAIASHRPYRPSRGVDAGLHEVLEYRGTRFDSEVVDACMRLFRERDFTFD